MQFSRALCHDVYVCFVEAKSKEVDPLAGKEVAACCWKGKYLFDHRHSQELTQFKVVFIELWCLFCYYPQPIDGYPGILMISNPLINMLTSLASCLSTPDIREGFRTLMVSLTRALLVDQAMMTLGPLRQRTWLCLWLRFCHFFHCAC